MFGVTVKKEAPLKFKIGFYLKVVLHIILIPFKLVLLTLSFALRELGCLLTDAGDYIYDMLLPLD